MRKIFNILISFILINLLFMSNLSTKAFCFNPFESNDEGYFQKIKTNFPIYGTAVNLKDGRVLITNTNSLKQPENIIFDPKTNKFRKTTTFGDDIQTPTEGVLLNDSKVLFIGPISTSYQPSEKFLSEIYNEMKKEKSFNSEDYRKYRQLSEEEKKKIYLPIFEKNPELLVKYKEYLKIYEDSMYAQLYNPDTEKIEYSGKLNIRRGGTKAVLLKDGNVLIIGGSSFGNQIKENEIFNPETGKFTLYNKIEAFGRISEAILLNDERIFLLVAGNYTIYDPKKNSFSEFKPFETKRRKILKLKDGRILIFTGDNSVFNAYKVNNPPENLTGGIDANVYMYTWQQFNAMGIKIYDPTKDEISVAGNLAIPRGDCSNFCFDAVVLKDGRVLITGGQKDIEEQQLGDQLKMMSEAEIFDPNTGKSKLIKNMNYEKLNHRSILLNDGRVLLYGGNRNELYIPKGFKN